MDTANYYRSLFVKKYEIVWHNRNKLKLSRKFQPVIFADRYSQHPFTGSGLVASHNDICNANWILSSNGDLYLIDLDSMSIDDPALDIGATLWWYYPPELRQRFLQIVGFADDQVFNHRMQIRMAMHCLNILLPREHSFDRFNPLSFAEALTDFRAAISGENNPQGYN